MYDQIPVEVFVAHAFQNPRISSLISGWRVDTKKLQNIGTTNFKEMGIFFTQPNQKPILLETLITILKTSPEVKALKKKAETEENERKRTRHADI